MFSTLAGDGLRSMIPRGHPELSVNQNKPNTRLHIRSTGYDDVHNITPKTVLATQPTQSMQSNVDPRTQSHNSEIWAANATNESRDGKAKPKSSTKPYNEGLRNAKQDNVKSNKRKSSMAVCLGLHIATLDRWFQNQQRLDIQNIQRRTTSNVNVIE